MPKAGALAARALALAPALIVIAACDSGTGSSGPGAVSEGEARALDEAAEMLEERGLPDGVLPPTGTPAAPTDGADAEADEEADVTE